MSRCLLLLLLAHAAMAARDLKQDGGARARPLPRDVRPKDQPEWRELPRVEYEALIHFAPGASEAAKQAALRRGHATQLEVVIASPTDGEVVLASVRPPPGLGVSTGAAAGAMRSKNGKADPAVKDVQPNYLYFPSEAPMVSNDPWLSSLWGMHGASSTFNNTYYAPTNVFGSRAARAWLAGDLGREGRDVYIGIIDVGVDVAHPDLAPNVGNPNEIPDNGIDDDGNGFVDDHFGWNFVDNNKNVFVSADDDYHGTHVAGTIGAVGGNGIGVVGVAPKVRMLNGRFMDANGGTTVAAMHAIDYFTNLKARGLNVVATSNSWGCACYDSQIKAAVQRANAANILFIAAAGNDGQNLDTAKARRVGYGFPSTLPTANVISVAAINRNGKRASWSNFGATLVDLGAPGVAILSTWPGSGYNTISGTSMATPHVSGAAALYAAKYNVTNAATIKSALLASARATPTSSLSGRCVTGGRLNIAHMLGLAE